MATRERTSRYGVVLMRGAAQEMPVDVKDLFAERRAVYSEAIDYSVAAKAGAAQADPDQSDQAKAAHAARMRVRPRAQIRARFLSLALFFFFFFFFFIAGKRERRKRVVFGCACLCVCSLFTSPFFRIGYWRCDTPGPLAHATPLSG